jgi:hypothetical protein
VSPGVFVLLLVGWLVATRRIKSVRVAVAVGLIAWMFGAEVVNVLLAQFDLRSDLVADPVLLLMALVAGIVLLSGWWRYRGQRERFDQRHRPMTSTKRRVDHL